MRRLPWALAIAIAAVDPSGPIEQPVLSSRPANAAEPIRISIAIKNRKVDAGQRLVRISQGDTLELAFSSDEAAELHLHGYDQLVAVEPSKRALLRVEAKIAGRFSLEAHSFGKSAGRRKHTRVVLLYVEVHPR